MRLRNLVNNWTSIWEKSTSAQGIVPAKSLGWDGTWDNQETAWKPMWQDQSRLGAAIRGAQVGGKALPWHRQRCQILPEEGLRKSALNNKISSNPALHLVSLFRGPPTCTLVIQPGRRSSENSQPWCLSGPSQGRGGVLTMNTRLLLHRNGHFYYWNENSFSTNQKTFYYLWLTSKIPGSAWGFVQRPRRKKPT